MRNFCYQTVIGLIIFTLTNSVKAELISGCFDDVTVTNEFTTLVEFKQEKLISYQETDKLKLRIMDGNDHNKIIREDTLFKKDGIWRWNKVLPFGEKLKFSILKDNKYICTEYRADTKSTLVFSAKDSLNMIRGVTPLSISPIGNNNEKKQLPIDTKELKNCKDKVLTIVFDKENNTLLWQYYGELRTSTDEIEFSKNIQPTMAIVSDDGGCFK